MAETLFKFEFTPEDMAYLRRVCAGDPTVFGLLATCGVEGVCLTRNQAALLGDHLTTILAQAGFDEDYGLTDEGKLIERLIDTLFVP